MRKIFFVVLCLCAWDTAVYAAPACGEIEEGCEAGQYCTETGGADSRPYCQSCPEDFSHSAPGSDEIQDCYKICSEEDEWPDSGYFDKENGRLELNGDEEINYISKDQTGLCLYTLVCNNENDECDGYHLAVDGYSCQPNKQECIEENGRGIQVWNKGEYSGCYITSCNEGVHFEPNGNIKCGQPVGACVSNDAWCAERLGNCGGTIGGEAHWIPDSEGWDYSACTCTTIGAVVENGTGSKTCGWSAGENDSTVWSSDCGVEITECNGGYCVQEGDSSKCVPAPKGYYGAGGTKVCQACPDVGTTTERVGAASAAECVMVRGVGGTRFCDDEGCFYLPGTGFIQKAN